eukprot:10392221-Alexandrium_andersonii.AAC.1
MPAEQTGRLHSSRQEHNAIRTKEHLNLQASRKTSVDLLHSCHSAQPPQHARPSTSRAHRSMHG